MFMMILILEQCWVCDLVLVIGIYCTKLMELILYSQIWESYSSLICKTEQLLCFLIYEKDKITLVLDSFSPLLESSCISFFSLVL